MIRYRRIALMVVCGLLISILIGINALHTIRQLIEMNKWVMHTQSTITETQHLITSLTNLDNDLRGYQLSRDPYFRADFERNTQQMITHLNKLQVLTKDNPVQQKRVQQLNTLLNQKLALSKSLLEHNRIKNGTSRLNSIQTYLAMSEQLDQVLKEAESEEEILLAQRAAQNRQSARYATISNIVGAATAFAMIMWATYLFFNALRNSRKLNKQLTDANEQTKKLLEAVPVSIIIVDRYGKFYYANEASNKLFGGFTKFDSYADVLKVLDVYRSTDGKPYPVEERPTYLALQGQHAQANDLEIRISNRSVQLLTSSSPVYDANGEIQYVISSSIDISDQVQSQNRLQEAKELAEKAVKVKENFLANMSHEIRTPLNAIMGFSDLLNLDSLEADQQEYVGFIRTAGKNLLTIVNDILDISKIEAGMIKLESIPFNIQMLTASLRTMLQPQIVEKELYLNTETDPDLPPVLLGDPTRLTQILLNLLSNAIKFTKQGGVSLRVKKDAEFDQAVRVQFSVEDTGIGIDPEGLPTIFERFQQANDFTTRFYGGTGLGLNIVKSLTELQGGEVSVSSVVGEGSVFTVKITYAVGKPETLEAADEQASIVAAANNRRVTVLVVEDNLINQKLILQVIKRLGYQADLADNGLRAIMSLQVKSYDIILMDIQMPIMDGYETTRKIRTNLKSKVPIIAMTAHALASEREECLKAGMNDFLSKPFQIEDLQRLIRKHLLNKEVEDQLLVNNKPATNYSSDFFIESLLKSTGDDMELAVELLSLLVTQLPEEIAEIKQAIDRDDMATVGRLIHSHKAHTKMLDMTEATRLILAIEELIKQQQDKREISRLVDEYTVHVDKAMPQFSRFLENVAKDVV